MVIFVRKIPINSGLAREYPGQGNYEKKFCSIVLRLDSKDDLF